MTPNPFSLLLHSRKFWLLILDTVVSLVLYFVGKYTAPTIMEDVKFLVLMLQPVFIAVIAAIAYEDVANAPFIRPDAVDPDEETTVASPF
jgi:hypothetical protein